MKRTKIYGWKRDLPDFRDYKFGYTYVPKDLPSKVDLRRFFPVAYNQGSLGSCTAQAIAAACQYELVQHKGKAGSFTPSRLFIYYNERYLENTIPYDAGSTLRSGVKSLNKWGFCEEELYPYIIKDFVKKPSQKVYEAAYPRRIYQYGRVNQDRESLCFNLADSQPIVFGFAVYESFESKKVGSSGVVPFPKSDESCLGGHAVTLVGYDKNKQVYIFRNSYGSKWGDNGYGYLPFSYVENASLAGDFWVIKAL